MFCTILSGYYRGNVYTLMAVTIRILLAMHVHVQQITHQSHGRDNLLLRDCDNCTNMFLENWEGQLTHTHSAAYSRTIHLIIMYACSIIIIVLAAVARENYASVRMHAKQGIRYSVFVCVCVCVCVDCCSCSSLRVSIV